MAKTSNPGENPSRTAAEKMRRGTLGAFLEYWLETEIKSRRSYGGYARFAAFAKRYLVPRFGGCRLDRLRPEDFEEYYADVLAGKGRSDIGRYLAGTLRSQHRFLIMALDHAARVGVLKSNPCRAAERPPLGVYKGVVLSKADANRLLAGASGTQLHVPLVLALAVGLYRSEIMGLRWRDVDFKRREIRIAQVLRNDHVSLGFKLRKSHGALRAIPLPEPAAAALKRHKKEQDEIRRLLGPAYENHDLVCARTIGTPIHPANIISAFARLRARLDIDVRFGDLRHSHFCRLLQAGVPAKEVCRLAGHSSIYVTRSIYDTFLRREDRTRPYVRGKPGSRAAARRK